jgi:hypothetical protein
MKKGQKNTKAAASEIPAISKPQQAATKPAKVSEVKSKAIKKPEKQQKVPEISKKAPSKDEVPVKEFKQRIKRKIEDFNKFQVEKNSAVASKEKEIISFLNLNSK